MMKAIPKKLLIHSALLSSYKDENVWGNSSLENKTKLERIRIEPTHKYVTTKENRQITLSAILFFDCVNSSPLNTVFKLGDRIKFNGTDYLVETVEPIYDTKLHHYEIGLSL